MKTRTCGGKTRQGNPCKRSPAPGSKRCELHGGQTLGGNALKHGRFTRNQKGQDFLLSVVKGKKGAGANLITHGASSLVLVQAYYSNNIDRRSWLGQMLSEWEQEYATHCGHDSPKDCPITIREKIRLAIGNRLFQMCYVPDPTNKTGYKDLRASENTLNRILSELGLKGPERDGSDLAKAIMPIVCVPSPSRRMGETNPSALQSRSD